MLCPVSGKKSDTAESPGDTGSVGLGPSTRAAVGLGGTAVAVRVGVGGAEVAVGNCGGAGGVGGKLAIVAGVGVRNWAAPPAISYAQAPSWPAAITRPLLGSSPSKR